MNAADKYVQDNRLVAEAMRNLDYAIQSALVTWNAGMSSEIANDDTVYDDDRADQGIPGLKGSDMWLFVTQMQAYKTQMDGAGVRAVVSKPCVRAVNPNQ